MKVLHLITHLNPGGIETWLLDVGELLADGRVDSVYSCKGSTVGALAARAHESGSRVYHTPLRASHFSYIKRLREIIQFESVDVVHVHTGVYSGVGVFVARSCSVPVVVTVHSTDHRAQSSLQKWPLSSLRGFYAGQSFRYALRHANYISATSSASLKQLMTSFGNPRHSRGIIRLGVRPSSSGSALPASQMLQRSKSPRVLISVGSFRVAKNHGAILRVFKGLLDRSIVGGVRLLLVGDGPLRPEIEAAIDRYGIGAFVTLTGQVDDARRWIATADLMLMPSVYEGFGKAAVEAGMESVPVVGSRVGGLCEAVIDGRTGKLFDVRDEASMTAACEELLVNESLRRRLGANSKVFCESNYSLAASAGGLLQLYDSLCHGVHPG